MLRPSCLENWLASSPTSRLSYVRDSNLTTIKPMNLRDTLQQILTRVDYRTLLLLSRSEILQNDISIITNDNPFWYSRLEYLAVQLLDWKPTDTDRNYAKIYFDMERAVAEKQAEMKHVHGASNLDSLLLIEHVYGMPDYSVHGGYHAAREFWSHIGTSAVLLHALDNKAIYSVGHNLYHLLDNTLENALRTRGVELVSACVDAILANTSRTGTLGTDALKTFSVLVLDANILLTDELREILGHMARLLAHDDRIHSVASYFKAVIETSNKQLWSIYSSVFKNRVLISFGTDYFARDKHLPTLKFLIAEEPWVVDKLDWNEVLLSAIHSSEVETIKFVSKYVNVATKANQILRRAAASSSQALEALLHDKRIDPMVELNEVILAILDNRPGKYDYAPKKATEDRKKNRHANALVSLSVGIDNVMEGETEKSLLVLTRDSRVDVSDDADEWVYRSRVRMLSYGLFRNIQPRLKGLILAAQSIKKDSDVAITSNVSELLEGPVTTYSSILHAIFFLDLDSVGLADWMIRVRDKQIQSAASAILTETLPLDRETAIVRGLLLMMLYPRLSLRENVSALRQEGMNEEDLLLCVQLIGALLATQMVDRM